MAKKFDAKNPNNRFRVQAREVVESAENGWPVVLGADGKSFGVLQSIESYNAMVYQANDWADQVELLGSELRSVDDKLELQAIERDKEALYSGESSSPRKKVYLSGPMTGIANFNHPEFRANTKFLRDSGWDVFSPAEMDVDNGIDPARALDDENPLTEEEYHELLKNDYRALIDCQAVAFMNGWENSRGAKLERRFGAQLGLDFYRVDSSKEYFEKELLIGLSAWAQSGKDTLADMLVEKHGFEKRGFAASLKGVLYDLNPIVDPEEGPDSRRVQFLVDKIGWEGAKKLPEIRQLLQRLGTEGGRKNISDDVWINANLEKPHAARLIVPDCRFVNEADAIRSRGGKMIRITRPGVGPINDHASETSLDNYDFDIYLENDGAPEKMLKCLEALMYEELR
jgi:hypothetical protein